MAQQIASLGVVATPIGADGEKRLEQGRFGEDGFQEGGQGGFLKIVDQAHQSLEVLRAQATSWGFINSRGER